MVNALLTLFRSGAELHRQWVDVPALVARMPVAGLEIESPPVGTTPSLHVDPDLLAAALANLFDNAVRHGAHRVQVRVEQDRLLLNDDGPGIAADRLAQLQTALDREDYAGFTGLGLILSDLVARAHGGRLRLGHGAQGGLQAELCLPAGAAGRGVH